ncbi:hypothetical protein [Microbacterium allomyrinae]|uniref:Uncharacterized protein n=1 Tax=Microbacterium allomyrinae TaxID=2830666 RepID=A0A9X1S419_9MICO|nr:hypothetical protein [Microbacterium allomyrinae]MCC2033087.1 hypothetical protein [Microbacterium allomyrinae]
MTLEGLEEPLAPPSKFTERDMLDLLARRYTQRSQGTNDRWVRAEHVRNGTGFYGYSEETGRCNDWRGLRTADFFAVDTYESKGHEIHGHEVKVSRSDWLHELADPTKAEAFKRYCTRWWLVTPDASIVRPGELPAGWGVLALRGGRLHAVHRAPKLDPLPMPKPLWISLMRAASKTAWKVTQ